MDTIETLESEVKKFANGLPYWAKFLAQKILSGNTIAENDIDNAYSYLLEELNIKEKTEKTNVAIEYHTANPEGYKTDLLLTKLENVEGVNALVDNQVIEFSPNLTIIYGSNGSGKSGYVRLLKKVFYSKAPEEILPNIHNANNKPINAKFTFKSSSVESTLEFSNKDNTEFKQFAVFDGKSVLKQLDQKNEFEFRPAGLSFFTDYTNAITRVEKKLNADIQNKLQGNTAADLAGLFDNDSEIKAFVYTLNAETTRENLKKYTPFSDDDKAQKEAKQKQYDELILAFKGTEKEIKNLEEIREMLLQNKQHIEDLNKFFTIEEITKVKTAITDCISKEHIAKTEGIENFKTDKIQDIGADEWKKFILSAGEFAKIQHKDNGVYPQDGDNCLFCQQPLSNEAKNLISNYWIFIQSVAESNAKQAQNKLKEIQKHYEHLNFELFSQNDILSKWLTDEYPQVLNSLKQRLLDQKTLAKSIVDDIENKATNNRSAIEIGVEAHSSIVADIDAKISILKGGEQSKVIENLRKEKIFLEHKEKFNTHFSKFEKLVETLIWIQKAQQASFAKRSITEKEKALSNKYFNQKYIDCFNSECQKLNGNFGVEISHSGSAGKSFRRLTIKGKNPPAILSEGEQKVIALADFLAEIQLSDINRGIVFDDPVTSLDEKRKNEIAERLVQVASQKQVIVFTHDLVFVSNILTKSENNRTAFLCHWIENRNNQPGRIWLNNSPSYEKEYRNAEPVRKHYDICKKEDCEPMVCENEIKQGFTALRTCYEVLVINDLFNSVVQRYNERVSINALSNIVITDEIVTELTNNYSSCCRFMEGHSHSDNFQYKKPTPNDLFSAIQDYEAIRKKIKDIKKTKKQ